MRTLALWLAILLVILPAPARAAADPTCVAAVGPWAAACERARALLVEPSVCSLRRLVLSLRAGSGA